MRTAFPQQIAIRLTPEILHDTTDILIRQKNLCDNRYLAKRITRSTVLRQALRAGLIVLKADLRRRPPKPASRGTTKNPT